MKDIPILGWVCLGAIIFMVIGLYLSLWTAWRRKDQKQSPPAGQGERIINSLRQPWAKEDAEWEKLHDQTEKFRKNPPPPPGE